MGTRKISKSNIKSAVFKPVEAAAASIQLEKFIRNTLKRSGYTGVVVPISGGLDSSVVAALCVRAIGNQNVTGLQLPECWGNPEAKSFVRALPTLTWYLG